MRLCWDSLFKRAVYTSFVIILLFVTIHPAVANSFGSLNIFGFPAAAGLTGPDSTMNSASSGNIQNSLSGLTAGNNYLSASSASVSPPSGYTGIFGGSSNGLWSGVNFGYPTASHDASNVAYAHSIAYEATSGNDAVSFPDINVNLGSLGSSFPTIASNNFDVKFAENEQLQLSTVSDTMPVSGFVFPAGFGSFFN